MQRYTPQASLNNKYGHTPHAIFDAVRNRQIADLEAVVKLLDKWQRTGKTPHYPGKI